MSDELRPEDAEVLPVAAEPTPEGEAEVAFVVPAPVVESIATDDELTAQLPSSGEPAAFPVGFAGPDLATADSLASLGDALHRKLDSLQTMFEREIRAEATREKVVDRLHAELQEYKQDLLLNVMRPVFVDLIQLHDDIGKIVESRQGAEGETGQLVELMRGFQQGIDDVLYRQGVEPFACEGESFDPRRQRAVSTTPTEDPSLGKTIAARHRKGYRAGEKVIRPEIVSVFAIKK
ncbi:nucleotide exchange factor GrpE [Singulisphaera sp. PoT]|uniref:nucleotide exchange factor GrpE n=1 Tax=Singulisphaera sp. PoT TaxID=3411797 RepID=UPI003BF58E94